MDAFRWAAEDEVRELASEAYAVRVADAMRDQKQLGAASASSAQSFREGCRQEAKAEASHDDRSCR